MTEAGFQFYLLLARFYDIDPHLNLSEFLLVWCFGFFVLKSHHYVYIVLTWVSISAGRSHTTDFIYSFIWLVHYACLEYLAHMITANNIVVGNSSVQGKLTTICWLLVNLSTYGWRWSQHGLKLRGNHRFKQRFVLLYVPYIWLSTVRCLSKVTEPVDLVSA